MWPFKRKHDLSDTAIPLVGSVRDETRQAKALEQQALLDEYKILKAETTLSDSQRRRMLELETIFWPARSRNPMNGVRRIPGGHGHPIPNYALKEEDDGRRECS